MSAAYADLTLPLQGSGTARQVLSRALSRLPGDVRAMSPAGLVSNASKEALVTVQELVARAVAAPRSPLAAAALSTLRRPTVGALLRCLRDDLRAGTRSPRTDAFACELAATLAIELALAGVLDTTVTVHAPPSRVLCLGQRRRITIADGTDRIEVSHESLGVLRAGARREVAWSEITQDSPWSVIEEPMLLALEDNNPFAIYGLSAEDPPNAVDLGGSTHGAWIASLQKCLALIQQHLPELRREMDLHVQQIIPIGMDPEIHRSATYRQAIGTLYLTLHPSLMTMTEAVIHESQHDKLHALMELDPVLLNATSERYRSPLRRDPRPLRGLLLAVHAFLPVERLYEAMTAAGHPLSVRPSFQKRHAQIREVNRDAAETVFAHARATPVGTALLEEIRSGLRAPG